MTLIVEDGTGLSNADALMSKEFCDSYCADRDLTDWLNGSGDPETVIRRATDYLCNSFIWKGSKVKGRLQSLAWPRFDVFDEEDLEVLSTEVPIEIKQACCILSAYEMANPGGLTPVVIEKDRVRSERIGPIAIEYVIGSTSADSARPVIVEVNDLISGLLEAGSESGLSGIVARA